MKYILDYNSFLNEGDIFQDGIKQSEVFKTKKHIIKNLLPLLRLKEDNIFFAGSSGKLSNPDDISLNINLIIDINVLKSNNNIDSDCISFLKQQIDRLKYNYIQKDDNTLIIDCPIEGKNNNGKVDIVITLTDNIDWIRFTRYSPDLSKNESEYSGKYRIALFSSIISSINKKVLSYMDHNDSIKEYSTFLFDKNSGVFKILKTFVGTHGELTSAYEIKDSRKLITNNPDEFINIIFSGKINKESLMTFEGIKDSLFSKYFKFPKKINQINSRFEKKCIELNLKPIKLLNK